MGGGGQQQSSTTSTEPWKGQQPYLTAGFSEAKNLYDQGPADFFPGQTYSNMDPATSQGLFSQYQTATDGNPLVGGAASNLTDTLSGKYLTPESNPYLSGTFDTAADKLSENFERSVIPGISSQFGATGGAGSTMHELALGTAAGEYTDSLRGLGSDIYGGNYANERNRQLQAAQMAPGVREAQFADAAKLQQVGARNEAQSDKVIQDQINRYNYDANKQQASLQDYMSMITGNYGSTSTSRSSSSSAGSPIATAIGAGMTAASAMPQGSFGGK